MIYLLEALNYYEDTWKITFYFVAALALLIGLLWTYYQVFIKGEKKKQPLKENIIYYNSEDIIENYNIEPKKKIDYEPINNYKINNYLNEIDNQKLNNTSNEFKKEKTNNNNNNNNNKNRNKKYTTNYKQHKNNNFKKKSSKKNW